MSATVTHVRMVEIALTEPIATLASVLRDFLEPTAKMVSLT